MFKMSYLAFAFFGSKPLSIFVWSMGIALKEFLKICSNPKLYNVWIKSNPVFA
jgi:hypothetical protein